jgi:3-oxoadipate enol-lactonase
VSLPSFHRTGCGPALVLIHGLGLDRRAWDAVTAALADDFTVITYDLPGHGTRPAPAPYAIADLARELLVGLDALGIDRAHVAGLSLGGLVAQAVAGNAPERVAGLALIDTTPRYDATWQATWRERAATVRTQGTAALIDGLLAAWFSPAFVAANGPTISTVRDSVSRMPAEGYARGCEALAAAQLDSLAATIVAPTLVVCGEDDGPQFRSAAAWFAATIPGARASWLPGKHAAVLEHPDLFVRLTRAFLVR